MAQVDSVAAPVNRSEHIGARYLTHPVSAQLSRYVSCVWSLESSGRTVVRPIAIPAYGCVELILHLAHPFAIVRPGELDVPARAILVGHLRRPMLLQPVGPFRTVGVRFHPGSHYPFFSVAGHIFDGRAISLDDLLPRHESRVARKLVKSRDIDTVCHKIQAWLLDRMKESSAYDLAEAAVAEITKTGGTVSVAEISQRLGIERRSLERHLLRVTGLRPKELCRVTRFVCALRASYANGAPSWSGIAASLGYYDQAHLIRDFRHFAGVAPTHRDRRLSLGQYVCEGGGHPR